MSDNKRKIGSDHNDQKKQHSEKNDNLKKQKKNHNQQQQENDGDKSNNAGGGGAGVYFRYGTPGFLITFDKGRDNQASKDMFTLLNNYLQDNDYYNIMNQLTKNDKVDNDSSSTTTTTSTTSSDNFMNSFEAELQQLQSKPSSNKKDNKNKQKQPLYNDPFERFKFHVEGMSFISIKENILSKLMINTNTNEQKEEEEEEEVEEEEKENNEDDTTETTKENDEEKEKRDLLIEKLKQILDVYQIANTLFEGMERDKSTKSKFISKIIPVQLTCSFTNLLEFIKPLVEERFNTLDKPMKYNIEFRSRHNTKAGELKKEFISVIADLIKSKHSVDLIKPDLTIIIEVVKTFTTISIVDNYIRFKKYNLSNIVGLIHPATMKNPNYIKKQQLQQQQQQKDQQLEVEKEKIGNNKNKNNKNKEDEGEDIGVGM